MCLSNCQAASDISISTRPRSDIAIFILGPLRKLQADLSKSEIGGKPNDLEAYIKLQVYLSELKKD